MYNIKGEPQCELSTLGDCDVSMRQYIVTNVPLWWEMLIGRLDCMCVGGGGIRGYIVIHNIFFSNFLGT